MTALYIDESKAHGYILAAAAVPDQRAAAIRKSVARLRLVGQQRVHFADERPARRKLILAELLRIGVDTHLWHVDGMTDTSARAWCLAGVADMARTHGVRRIVIETDDTLVERDRRTLYSELQHRGVRKHVSYSHDRAASEPLLWIPDAVAWCFARGGEWRSAAGPLIASLKHRRG